jgi:hypothetical protein
MVKRRRQQPHGRSHHRCDIATVYYYHIGSAPRASTKTPGESGIWQESEWLKLVLSAGPVVLHNNQTTWIKLPTVSSAKARRYGDIHPASFCGNITRLL